MQRTTLRLSLLCALSGLAALSQAWNATGHMVIAAVADRFLTPDVRQEVARLAKIGATDQNSDPFGAAVWADDVRSARSESAPWHYINIFFRRDGKPVVGKPQEENVVVAIKRFTAILADRSRPDLERAEALRYVMHFVGDIHQPLHAVAFESDTLPDGDKGGNSYRIQPASRFGDTERGANQLHSLWDSGCGILPQVRRPLTTDGVTLVRRQADTLIAALPRQSFRERKIQDPMEWAKESFELAKKVAYAVPQQEAPDSKYFMLGQNAAAKRLALAGYRLADVLNKTLGSSEAKKP